MKRYLNPYPDMKDTGISWVGSIPSHWQLLPGMAVLRERQVKNIGMKEKTVLSLSYGNVVVKPDDKLHGLVPESFETYQIVEPGNIIIRPTDLQNDYNSLRVGLAHDRGIITSAYINMESLLPLSSDYAQLALHTYDLKKVFYGLGSGLRQNLDWSDFRRMPIVVPPSDEQKQIVSYVRYIELKTNQLIRAKRRLIELLNEQKQVIIHRAVTRGLDPSVTLKSSGVEWLGKIPAHWEIRRLKSIATIKYGLGQPPKEMVGGLPLLRATNITRGEITEKGMIFVDPSDVPKDRDAFLKPGDIIVVRSGAYTADSAIVTEKYNGAVTGYDMVVRSHSINSNFLSLALLSKYVLDNQLFILRSRAAQPHLNAEELGGCLILLPPRNEQQAINQYINNEMRHLQVAIKTATSEIELIREYRTRLVADVVTGQLDVRHLDLPDIEEPVSMDAEEQIEEDEMTEEESDADE